MLFKNTRIEILIAKWDKNNWDKSGAKTTTAENNLNPHSQEMVE